MKPIEVALYNKMATTAAVANLVGGTAAPRIYNTIVPQGTTLPAIVFQKIAGGHTNDTPRENMEPVYQVKVLSSVLDDAEDIDLQLTTALDRKDLQVSSGYADYACWRLGHIHFVEVLLGGSIIYHIGGYFQVMASGTA